MAGSSDIRVYFQRGMGLAGSHRQGVIVSSGVKQSSKYLLA